MLHLIYSTKTNRSFFMTANRDFYKLQNPMFAWTKSQWLIFITETSMAPGPLHWEGCSGDPCHSAEQAFSISSTTRELSLLPKNTALPPRGLPVQHQPLFLPLWCCERFVVNFSLGFWVQVHESTTKQNQANNQGFLPWEHSDSHHRALSTLFVRLHKPK